jgi:hypothetical protein
MNHAVQLRTLQRSQQLPLLITAGTAICPILSITLSFYNIYIPANNSGGKGAIDHALEIVREQLDQVRASFAIQDARSKHQTVTLYYNTIGNRHAITNDFMNHHCSEQQHESIRCKHMNHHDSAFEQVTLQKMREYCPVNPPQRIICIHNKGSYHLHGHKDHWRRSLTAAATSEHCVLKRQPGSDAKTATETTRTSFCNVCGLQFHPIWTIFFLATCLLPTANSWQSWSLQCSTKRKCATWQKMSFFNLNFDIQIYNTKQMIQHDFWGVGRYADEHWIASHLDIAPCDVSKTTNLWFWVSQARPTNNDTKPSSLFHLTWHHEKGLKAATCGPVLTIVPRLAKYLSRTILARENMYSWPASCIDGSICTTRHRLRPPGYGNGMCEKNNQHQNTSSSSWWYERLLQHAQIRIYSSQVHLIPLSGVLFFFFVIDFFSLSHYPPPLLVDSGTPMVSIGWNKFRNTAQTQPGYRKEIFNDYTITNGTCSLVVRTNQEFTQNTVC